ncbi:MAG: L,D-transpeptidase [Flavobacteriaceae bacterium]
MRICCGIPAVLLSLVACLLAAAPAAAAPSLVGFSGYPKGAIVIRTGERRLYFVTGRDTAIAYPVALGKPGKLWHGETRIRSKHVRPSWSPPEDVWRDNPKLPAVIPPGPSNPMGERAMVLARDQYAIHGTNRPESIGRYVSYGCIRMYNADIIDLFDRVRVGTPVLVTN